MKVDSVTSRREFLKKGAAGLAGAALLSSGACSRGSKEKSEKTGQIVYRTLGRTGLKLPIVSMGSIYAINLVRAALDEGIVYIHTASGYSEKNHERLLGEVFKDRPRDSFVVATSPDLPYREGPGGRSLCLGTNVDPELISKSLEGSLRRLRLDFVDIFYLASVGTSEVTQHKPYMDEFDKLKREGKMRFAGVITHSTEPAVIRGATESGFWDIVLTAYNFRQSHRDEVRAAIREAAEAGLGVAAMKTQAGVYWDRTRLRKINMKAALKWVLEDENVHTTIPAFRNFDEMREDLAIMRDPKLTPEEMKDLRLGDELGFSGCYCQGCCDCLAQCPSGMDIPVLMRAHMYAFSYGDPEKARDSLQSWKSGDVCCVSCEECVTRCSLGLDLKSRALDMVGFVEDPGGFTP